MGLWWNHSESFNFNDESFQKILDFYLFNCPVENQKGKKEKNTLRYEKVSQRGTSLRNLGWEGVYLTSLISKLKNGSFGPIKYCEVKSDAKELFNEEKELSAGLCDKNFEMILFKKNDSLSILSSILYYIRCAIAHGSFSEKKGIYYFESKKNEKTKARIRLRSETLLLLMKTIKKGPKSLTNMNARRKSSKRKIKNSKNSSKVEKKASNF